jgi:GH15 family glucan-1,4-alpha-glucosidase
MDENSIPNMQGFRGMGPVRVGNAAYHQVQNDVYGSVILAASHVFFDQRLEHRGDESLFHRLEDLGELAREVYDKPDAGLWELRNSARVHTFSSVMCWVACDRLSRIAAHIGLADRAAYWRKHADGIHRVICERSFDATRNTFVECFDGKDMDASLLLLKEMDFLAADDPRFAGTVAMVEKELKHGDLIYRYRKEDDFGRPETAFLVCTFWYIDALAALGRRDEARDLFEKMLSYRNPHGLLSEDVDPKDLELWGNFPQTYSMVGLIHSALRLSNSWENAF